MGHRRARAHVNHAISESDDECANASLNTESTLVGRDVCRCFLNDTLRAQMEHEDADEGREYLMRAIVTVIIFIRVHYDKLFPCFSRSMHGFSYSWVDMFL